MMTAIFLIVSAHLPLHLQTMVSSLTTVGHLQRPTLLRAAAAALPTHVPPAFITAKAQSRVHCWIKARQITGGDRNREWSHIVSAHDAGL